jgi:hypothetical protein
VRDDNIPLDPWLALVVVGSYAVVALTLGFWAISRRGA